MAFAIGDPVSFFSAQDWTCHPLSRWLLMMVELNWGNGEGSVSGASLSVAEGSAGQINGLHIRSDSKQENLESQYETNEVFAC